MTLNSSFGNLKLRSELGAEVAKAKDNASHPIKPWSPPSGR
jgi:hypothetical protein